MSTLLVAFGSFFAFIIAYNTYGRWLARRIFGLDPKAQVPSHQLRDDVDFVPTKREVIFGHHFTSIAGTGPIVGPALAVFWGWLPALLWVVFGSIFIGAVHDFGALVVSLRNRGQTIGDIAGRIIAPRARLLFLFILFFALTIVLAIFGLVIATIFARYPESVLSVWVEIPLAIGVGYWVYRKGGSLLWPSIAALGVMYLAIYVGAYYLPIKLSVANPIIVWTGILFVYCFIASVLPVWTLLQPRDFINSHELMLALFLLCLGLVAASLTGQADLFASAPAMVSRADMHPETPPIWPFLFITVACGAVSGFHCLVSSGTTSKQVANEQDAQYVGYGAMLLEGALAVVVILACCAGVGMGQLQRGENGAYSYVQQEGAETHVAGLAAWKAYYPKELVSKNPETGVVTTTAGWAAHKLPQKLAAFIEGGANFMTSIGIPLKMGIGIVAVLVASFAATTLDTATRLQRYVIQEIAATVHITPLTNKYAATFLALALGGAMALMRVAPDAKMGTGGLILWPLFGAVNQLLAGLAFMVTVFYLWRRKKPIWFVFIPMVLMIIFPTWAMSIQMNSWIKEKSWHLVSIGGAVMVLQAWMIVEAIIMWPKAKGVLEDALPPLKPSKLAESGGRSC